jgi:hypothetical protein
MSKRKATTELSSNMSKKFNTSQDYVFYNAINKHNDKNSIQKISPTKVGKRPIYKFLIDFDGNYSPLKCMLDLSRTSFVISPEATKAFKIPVVRRNIPTRTSDVSGTNLQTEALYTIPLGLSLEIIGLMMWKIMHSKL